MSNEIELLSKKDLTLIVALAKYISCNHSQRGEFNLKAFR